jgi:predicted GNAT family acetyltransferase
MLSHMGTHVLDFVCDPAEFLAAAGARLRDQPVVSTVVATIAQRAMLEQAKGIAPPAEDWWLVVRDDAGQVVGAAMRTAPAQPRPAFVLPMPEPAARLLARTLHDRGEAVGAANGALPAVEAFADETARLTGGSVAVAQHTRLFELGQLVEPAPVGGTLAQAGEDDLELAVEWFSAFMDDADEQAGRPRGSSAHETPGPDDVRRRIAEGCLWFWVDEAGERVHLTAANPPSLGVARIGPVYTPVEQRGRGYATAAVAEVSRLIRDGGSQACLFTDQANPTSNRIYQALGYVPVVDMVNLVIG